MCWSGIKCYWFYLVDFLFDGTYYYYFIYFIIKKNFDYFDLWGFFICNFLEGEDYILVFICVYDWILIDFDL